MKNEARWTDSKPKGQITRRRLTKDDLLGGYFIIDINFLQSLFFVRLLDICRYGGKSAHFGRVISCFGFEICSSDVLVGELHIAVARQAASVLHPVEFFLVRLFPVFVPELVGLMHTTESILK